MTDPQQAKKRKAKAQGGKGNTRPACRGGLSRSSFFAFGVHFGISGGYRDVAWEMRDSIAMAMKSNPDSDSDGDSDPDSDPDEIESRWGPLSVDRRP